MSCKAIKGKQLCTLVKSGPECETNYYKGMHKYFTLTFQKLLMQPNCEHKNLFCTYKYNLICSADLL